MTDLSSKAAQKKWPAAKVEIWPIGKLKPYERNSRSHPPEQIEVLKELFRKVGWTQPILADEKGEIIAGHGRHQMAEGLGLTHVPVAVARGWSESDRKAYRLSDNSSAQMAAWIPEFVRSELEDLGKMNFDTSGWGIDDIELPPLEEMGETPSQRAGRSKKTIFVSIANADVDKARKLIVTALDKARIVHNL